MPITNSMRYIIRSVLRMGAKEFFKIRDKGLVYKSQYECYDAYLAKQKEKTTDPQKILKWKNQEWEFKLEGFREVFTRNSSFIEGKKKAICLGSRTGQEVLALRELGIDAIGVDLVEFPPYTVVGDIHDLQFEDGSFDLCFTNIMDHSLFPEKFCQEIERVCVEKGVIILNLQIGFRGDQYSENIIYDEKHIIDMFDGCLLSEKRSIRNSFDEMNLEVILTKSG